MGRRSSRRGQICLIGAFPPPLNGASSVNDRVRRDLQARAARLVTIDLADRTKRGWSAHLIRTWRVLIGLVRLCVTTAPRSHTSMYIGLSGGSGQLYDIAFAALGRALAHRLVLHHHSYRYLNRRSQLTALLLSAAGRKAIHVVLCDDMSNMIRRSYRQEGHRRVVSNAALIDPDSTQSIDRHALRTIGFLSNITVDKGINEFLEVVERLGQSGCAIKAIVAGPITESDLRNRLLKRMKELSVTYVGPQYGSERANLYNSIDLLLFPSKYAHEADPLTVHEALAAGVPVVATRRGCLGYLSSHNPALVTIEESDFVSQSCKLIEHWITSPHDFLCAVRDGLRSFQRVRDEHWTAYQGLLDVLMIDA